MGTGQDPGLQMFQSVKKISLLPERPHAVISLKSAGNTSIGIRNKAIHKEAKSQLPLSQQLIIKLARMLTL